MNDDVENIGEGFDRFLAERGIGHAMLADRAAPRALSLEGRRQKKKGIRTAQPKRSTSEK